MRRRRRGKRRKSTFLPVDVLAAVSRCSTVFVKFGNFVVVVVVVDAWAMTGFFVNCCDGGRFFLCTDGRITSILSPWGRWITVVVALLWKRRKKKKEREDRWRENNTRGNELFILDWTHTTHQHTLGLSLYGFVGEQINLQNVEISLTSSLVDLMHLVDVAYELAA